MPQIKEETKYHIYPSSKRLFNNYFILMNNLNITRILLLAFVFVLATSATTSPVDALGTVLPQLNPYYVSPHRIFNDLMKQSLTLVPYQVNSWGGSGRCWSCSLTQIGGLKHQYPASLPTGTWAVA